jgi:DNA repair exonuclease SbcCD ATPase subunit
MPFDVRDFHDLVRLLEAHPEWRAELRRLVLSEELLRLPELVRELVEAQSRTQQQLEELSRRVNGLADRVDRLAAQIEALTAAQARAEERLSRLEERVDRLEEAVARLTEAQARAEERLTRLEEAVARLTEAQARAEERLTRLEEAVARLTEAQARAEERLTRLEERVDRLEIRVGRLEGRDLERYYRERAPAIFGQAGFSRVRVIPIEELASRLDDLEEQGLISPEERLRLLRTDLVVRARSQGREVWLAVEVSTTVDSQDVERAVKSAELLGRIFSVEVRPVVAGHRLLPEAEELGQPNNVLVITDGAAA